MKIEKIPLCEITADPDTQARETIDQITVNEYAAAMDAGAEFPPIVVFRDDKSTYWLADGWHRWHAAQQIDLDHLAAEVHQGTRRDAILFACGANSNHGLKRSNDDKRRAVSVMLRDEEWGTWSDREIGRRCAVDHGFVGKLRKVHTGDIASMKRTFTHPKTGKPSQMNTSNIGANTAQEPEEFTGFGDDPPKGQPDGRDHPDLDQVKRPHEKPARDAVDQIIPPEMVEPVFLDAANLSDWQKQIQRVRAAITQGRDQPYAAWLHHQGLDQTLKKAWEIIKFAAPYAVCPDHKPSKCPNCKGRGWLPKEQYESLVKAKK